MRRLFLFGCVLVLAVGVSLSASGQTVSPSAQAKIAAILAQFPDGGSGLADAIATAVEEDPSLAAAAVAAAANATPAQQQAMGYGLAAAAAFFASQAAAGGADADAARDAEQQILTAMALAPPMTQVAFAEGGGFMSVASSLAGSITTLTTNACVSPSAPGGRC